MFLVQCPRCKQRMKYQGQKGLVSGKRKRCVYCGHTMNVKDNILKRLDS